MVSLGNTGGIFAAATFKLGRIPGVDRGGIATVIPTPDHEFVLLDSGANIECKPLHLAHYAVMGSIYSREILGYKNPRVGILSIGTEETKGNELTLEAFKLCKLLDLNFIGNVEGHDLFRNHVDVVVCDGFVGNIVLKTCESLALAMFSMLKRELTANPRRQLGALLAQNAFRTIKRRMDPEGFGGAPLLGFNGTVMKAHGSARERAIANAIRITTENIQHQVNQIIAQEIARANERLARRRNGCRRRSCRRTNPCHARSGSKTQESRGGAQQFLTAGVCPVLPPSHPPLPPNLQPIDAGSIMSPSSTPKFKNPRAKYNFQGRTCSISGVGSYVPAKNPHQC